MANIVPSEGTRVPIGTNRSAVLAYMRQVSSAPGVPIIIALTDNLYKSHPPPSIRNPPRLQNAQYHHIPPFSGGMRRRNKRRRKRTIKKKKRTKNKTLKKQM